MCHYVTNVTWNMINVHQAVNAAFIKVTEVENVNLIVLVGATPGAGIGNDS